MMRHILNITIVAALLLLSGCIRKELEDCPPLRIRLEVEDKNYFNIDPVETATGLDHRVDENLPFSSYVGSLYYAIYPKGSQNPYLVEPLHQVKEENMTHELLFPQEMPFGEYDLVVWGNIESTEGIDEDGKATTYRLHGGQREGYDVYMGSLSLVYNEKSADHVIPLKRVKGKLIIEVVGMPGEVSKSHKAIDHLYSQVDAQWQYTGSEEVHTEEHWEKGQHSILTDTYLAPTDGPTDSQLTLNFVPATDGQPTLPLPAATKIRMKRNEITILRYVYNAESDGFDIYLLIDDSWILIHDMDIEE